MDSTKKPRIWRPFDITESDDRVGGDEVVVGHNHHHTQSSSSNHVDTMIWLYYGMLENQRQHAVDNGTKVAQPSVENSTAARRNIKSRQIGMTRLNSHGRAVDSETTVSPTNASNQLSTSSHATVSTTQCATCLETFRFTAELVSVGYLRGHGQINSPTAAHAPAASTTIHA
jgi:hypothetical protein